MQQNPFTVIPDSVRLWLYMVIFVAVLAFAAWEAAGGDWMQALSAFVVSLAPLMAASNTGDSGSPVRVTPKSQ